MPGTAPAATSQSRHWAARARGLGGTVRDMGTQRNRGRGGGRATVGQELLWDDGTERMQSVQDVRAHRGRAMVSVTVTTADTRRCHHLHRATSPARGFLQKESHFMAGFTSLQVKPAAQGWGTPSPAMPTGACWLGDLRASSWRHKVCK